MALCTAIETSWTRPQLDVQTSDADQTRRIRAVFGLPRGGLPKVDEQSLSQYFHYLESHLPLPFAAYYPQPTNSREKAEFQCTVVELLDPAGCLGDEFDGIFCKFRKGDFEVNLPLMELHVPPGSLHFQIIEDYWYWFWNWR